MHTLRIWDQPTRVFHWLLALCVLGLWVTGQIGGPAMLWHFYLGQTVLTLLVFRLLWGLVGGHWSRWWRLPLGWAALRAYWRGQATPLQTAGHNPMGAWSVLCLLGLTGLQVATGLFADDDIAHAGPLTASAPGAWVSRLTRWHSHWGWWLLMGWVALHIAAIVHHHRRGQRLLPAMWHGDKTLPAPVPPSRDGWPQRLLALLCLALAALSVAWAIPWGA